MLDWIKGVDVPIMENSFNIVACGIIVASVVCGDA